MATWTVTTAAALATLMFAGPAFAQATTGRPAAGTETKSEKAKGARKGGVAMGDEKVKAAQQALKDKGHDPGEVDGTMGPKTQAALRDFQKAEGMEATGHLDEKTTQALGMEGGKTSSAGESSTAGSASPGTPAASGAPIEKTTEEKK